MSVTIYNLTYTNVTLLRRALHISRFSRHGNKISQAVGRETHPGDIIINGTGPGFPGAVWEAEELIPALRCPQVSARDHFESQLGEGSVIQSAKFGRVCQLSPHS